MTWGEVLFLGCGAAFASVFGAMAGVGGGLLLVPILLVGFGFPPQVAVGTSLVSVLVSSASGTVAFWRQRRTDFRAGLTLSGTGIAGSLAGAWITRIYTPRAFALGFGVFLALAALYMVFRRPAQQGGAPGASAPGLSAAFFGGAEYVFPGGERHAYRYSVPAFLSIGALAGVLSGALGVGGGVLLTPVMIYAFSFPAHVATATAQFVIIAAALTGVVAHSGMDHVRWAAAPALAAGALVGAQFGARFSVRLRGAWLVRLLALAMLAASARLLWAGRT